MEKIKNLKKKQKGNYFLKGRIDFLYEVGY
jgi:hypothetical protein